jgi:hypothetical protein
VGELGEERRREERVHAFAAAVPVAVVEGQPFTLEDVGTDAVLVGRRDGLVDWCN